MKLIRAGDSSLCHRIRAGYHQIIFGKIKLLNSFLIERLKAGETVALLIDEAHDIRPEVLAILRILTNFDMDSRLVVSFVLAGQPPLAKLLRQDKLEAVAQRLTHCATLRLLSRQELAHYITHRCRIAGATSIPFDSQASEALYEIGRGNLRATDHLALKSLHCAHDADADLVDTNHVVEARRLLWA